MVKPEGMIERLLTTVSSLGEIGKAIASSGDSFSSSSRKLLRMILETMKISKGAILIFEANRKKLVHETTVGIEENELELSLKDGEVDYLLGTDIIDFNQELASEFAEFINRNEEQLKSLESCLWVPLKIRNDFLGVISLSKPVKKEKLDLWDEELIKIIAMHTSIAIKISQLVEDSRRSNFRLFRLSDISAQISSLLRAEDLENEIIYNAISLLDARSGCIMLVNQDTKKLQMRELFGLDESLYGLSVDIEEHMLGKAVKNGESVIINDPNSDLIFGNSKILASPIKGMEETLGVLIVCDSENRKGEIVDFTENDELLLSALANQAGISIENARLYQEALDIRSMRADIEAAAQIQRNFLPDRPPELSGYEFAGMSIPRGGVGGDYYDYINEGDGHIGIVIADVSGKGTQAALLMATFRANLLTETKREHDLEKIVKLINLLIYESSPVEKYVTFFYGRLYPEEGVFEYINAGHNPPIIVRADGKLEYTLGHSSFVGTFPPELFDSTIEIDDNNKVTLKPDDLIVFYTDGVTEATDLEDEQFGLERLEAILKEHHNLSAEELKELIYDKVLEFQGKAESFDDLTVVVLKVR